MTLAAGDSPATQTIRCTTRTEAQGQTERNIRTAHDLLAYWGIPMSANRVKKHVKRFAAEVTGWSFFDYLANAVQVDEQRRAETRTELDAYLRATYALDPVGVTAVRNVTREGKR